MYISHTFDIEMNEITYHACAHIYPSVWPV